MKHKTSFLSALLLAELLTLGGMACLITGFQMEVGSYLLPVLGLETALFALLWAMKWDLWLLLGIAGYSLYQLHNGLWLQLKSLLQLIGRYYYMGYGWDIGGLFSQTNATIFQVDMTAACLFIGLLLGLALSYLLYYRRPLWLSLPVALLPLTLTLVVQDTAPAEAAIFPLMLGLGLLLLTQATSRQNRKQGDKLTAALLLPVTLAVALLMLAIPQEGYTPPDLSSGILSFLQGQSPNIPVPPVNTGVTVRNWVNLSQLGPKDNSSARIMELTTSYSGHIYLRANHYSTYTGLRWTDGSNLAQEDFTLQEDYLRQMEDEISITTLRAYEHMFLPYYPRDGEMQGLEYGSLSNPRKWTSYTVAVRQLRSDWQVLWELRNPRFTLEDMDNQDAVMTALPAETLVKASEYLAEAGITWDMSPLEAAQRIAAFVADSAKYDMKTGRMPASETDFAIWFLEEAETGYCVHFATAAAVLLRAAGIPARYVEGYVAYLPGTDNPLLSAGGVHLTVTRRMAHAWVEYYLPQVGWVILEATPGGFTEDPEPTTEPTTLPPAASTQTTAPTLPSKNTVGTSGPQTTGPQSSTGTGAVRPQIQLPKELLVGLAIFAAAVLGLLLQWRLRLWALQAWLSGGSRKKQAMKRWKFAKLLARLCREPAPEALLQLAQRAAFSQHPTTGAELARFEAYFAACVAKLRKRGFVYQLLYRWILAIY